MICPRCGRTHVPNAKLPIVVAVCDLCISGDIIGFKVPKQRPKRRPKRPKKEK